MRTGGVALLAGAVTAGAGAGVASADLPVAGFLSSVAFCGAGGRSFTPNGGVVVLLSVGALATGAGAGAVVDFAAATGLDEFHEPDSYA